MTLNPGDLCEVIWVDPDQPPSHLGRVVILTRISQDCEIHFCSKFCPHWHVVAESGWIFSHTALRKLPPPADLLISTKETEDVR
jgi:hypothetical protein